MPALQAFRDLFMQGNVKEPTDFAEAHTTIQNGSLQCLELWSSQISLARRKNPAGLVRKT